MKDKEIDLAFVDPGFVVFKTPVGEDEVLPGILCFKDINPDYLRTDLPVKAELKDMINRIRERIKKSAENMIL